MTNKPGKECTIAFISYSHKDKKALKSLIRFIEPLEANNQVCLWYDERNIVGGDPVEDVIEKALKSAQLVLLILSQSFITSHNCQKELNVALGRLSEGEAFVVGILWNHCTWKTSASLGRLKVIPDKPIIGYRPHDKGWNEVHGEIDKLLSKIRVLIGMAKEEIVPISDQDKQDEIISKDEQDDQDEKDEQDAS